MLRFLFLLLFQLEILNVIAQIPSCDGFRYKDSVFSHVDSLMNLKYGKNYTMNHVLMDLTMNVFMPANDTVKKRPVIIFMHGGGFVSGKKQDVSKICIAFAQRGYVTATIDYRLIDITVIDSITITEGLVDAVSDAKAAIRFFVQDAATSNLYKVDTNFIFISGISAGAVIASHVAYLDPEDDMPAYLANLIMANGGYAGNSSTNLSYPTPIRGVLNYSGALLRKEFISTGEPALFSVHDEGDTIVPCGHGASHAYPCIIYCDGSCAMQQEATLKGVNNGMFLNHTNGHCAYFSTLQKADTIIQKSADFLWTLICSPTVAVNKPDQFQGNMLVFPNPANEKIHIVFTDLPKSDEIIQVMNSMGILLIEVEAHQSTQIDISKLPAGLYFICSNNHTSDTRVFIKE
jgi:alpha/beta superfamily hydrolase